jgi:Undecaprenyl-phosphate galactose phosphotransferase WbaP
MSSIAATRPVHPPVSAIPAPIARVDALSGPRAEAWRQRLVNLALISSDVVLAFVIWEVACLAQILAAPGSLSGASVAAIVPIALVWVMLRAAKGLYPGYGMDEAQELRRQTHALLATLAFAAVFALAFGIGDAISRLLLAVVFVGLLLLSPLMRHLTKKWMRRHGVWGKPVIVLGARDAGLRVEESLLREWKLGFRPVAQFDGRQEGRLAEVKTGEEGKPGTAGVLRDAMELGRKHRVDTLFLAMPHAPREYLAELVDFASVHFRSVVIIPDLAGIPGSTVTARNLAGTLGVEVRHNLLDPWVRRTKRALDITAATIGGLAILPLFLALCLLLRLESRGPIFYSAKRMGRDDELFSCMKFRTMVPDAEATLQRMLEEDPLRREEYATYHKLRDDPRITRVGRLLRKTSLDELPQLWNVLRGEMSLVGPRPYLPRESLEIGARQGDILRVHPGITGPWQVGGRNETSFAERVHIDSHYARNWSFWLDLVILARTVRCMLAGSGAY